MGDVMKKYEVQTRLCNGYWKTLHPPTESFYKFRDALIEYKWSKDWEEKYGGKRKYKFRVVRCYETQGGYSEKLKKTPIKVTELYEDDNFGYKRGRCIQCSSIIEQRKGETVNQCPKCGQAVKWK